MNLRNLSLALMCAVCSLSAQPARALDFDFSGTIANHNDVSLFTFSTASPSTVTLFTSSWDDGGFDPMLGLWDSTGLLIEFQDDGGLNGSTTSNGIPYDYGIFDSYYTNTLLAGTYTVSVSTYPNNNNGLLLSAGFNFDGQTPIPIALWDQPPALNGFRTGNFAFHVLNVTQATGPSNNVPESSSLFLLVAGLAGLAAWRQQRWGNQRT
jgi:hypothetical protein